jgi:hypothetical protein
VASSVRNRHDPASQGIAAAATATNAVVAASNRHDPASPVPPTTKQLGYLRGLKDRRLRALERPTSRQEVTEVAVLVSMMAETPVTFAMAARQIEAVKGGNDGVLAFGRGKKRQRQYQVLLRELMAAGLLRAPYPSADLVRSTLAANAAVVMIR